MPPVAPDTLRLWSYLPQFVQEGDAASGYQFLRWLDGIGQQQQIIDTLCRDQGPNPGWSILLDVTRCPTYALPWLAQFVGVRFSSTQTTDAAQRSAIIGEQGFNRGTVSAIQAVALQYLKPGYSVTVVERTNFPRSISYAEVDSTYPIYIDVDEAFPRYNNFTLVNRPDAYRLTIQIPSAGLMGFTYATLDGAYAMYSQVDAAFPTYATFTTNTTALNAAILAAIPAGLVATLTYV